ncbi:MAG: hypothetical protein ABSG74_11795 [Candidatus Bathyarchaeia archaeon]|jgi:acyl-CoA reductase-like NAD-dependent aldehyde dehydrogenase
MRIAKEEMFGPAACIVRAGNIGIRIGIAAPMTFFPFAGFRDFEKDRNDPKSPHRQHRRDGA